MVGPGACRRWVVVPAAVAALLLAAGCSSPSYPTMMGGNAAATDPSVPGPGMMSGSSGATTTAVPYGPGMMAGGSGMMGASGYAYSRLTCAAPTSLPGSTVNVTLGDMGMTQMMGGVAPLGGHMMLRATPATVPGGQVSLVVSNMGWRTHELVVPALADRAAVGQRVSSADGKVDETASLGEVSNSCAAGAGDGITAGAVGWTIVTLAPGRYELVVQPAESLRQRLPP